MPTCFWLSKEICTAPRGVLLTWTERWWVSISKSQLVPAFALSNLKDTWERQVPRLSPGPVRLHVPKYTTALGMQAYSPPAPAPDPEGNREAQPEAAPWAAVKLSPHWPFVLLSESQIPGVAEKVKAVHKQNLAVLVSLPSFLFLLLAGSH